MNENRKFFINEITSDPDRYANEHEVRYGIDKVEFVSKLSKHNVLADKANLVGRISRKVIGNFHVHDLKEKYSPDLYKKGYRSRIILTRFFSRKIFEVLEPIQATIGKPHIVEIFQDIVCQDDATAILLANHQISYAHMIYGHGTIESHIYDRRRIKTYTKERPPKSVLTEEQYLNWLFQLRNAQDWLRDQRKDIIGDRTLYIGKKEDLFKFVVYARSSKEDKKPVLHSEFRLVGREQMKRLGVLNREMGYLKSFQNEKMLHAARLYKEFLSKRIRFNKINNLKLAKHYLCCENKKSFNKKEMDSITLYANELKRLYGNYTAGFAMYADHHRLDKRLYLTL